MSTSLESRIPLLDHRIVEWAWSLPESLKLDATIGKKVMRDLLYTYVPKKLLDRDKQGFGIPVGLWVRDELKDWANNLMSQENLQKTNIFHPKKITALWEGHRDGKIDQQHHIWSILSLQSWMLENQTSLS
jgi:asparagine synthase (glutamine-hydrolysing)